MSEDGKIERISIGEALERTLPKPAVPFPERMDKRPRTERFGCLVSTPQAAGMIALLGGQTSGGVAVSNSQLDALKRLYGIRPETHAFLEAGACRDVFRAAEADGLRLIAWLAPFVAKGEDPLKILVQMAIDAGYDVDPSDVAWSEEESQD